MPNLQNRMARGIRTTATTAHSTILAQCIQRGKMPPDGQCPELPATPERLSARTLRPGVHSHQRVVWLGTEEVERRWKLPNLMHIAPRAPHQ